MFAHAAIGVFSGDLALSAEPVLRRRASELGSRPQQFSIFIVKQDIKAPMNWPLIELPFHPVRTVPSTVVLAATVV